MSRQACAARAEQYELGPMLQAGLNLIPPALLILGLRTLLFGLVRRRLAMPLLYALVDLIVAAWDVPPERPELHISIGPDGVVTSYRAQRWRDRESGYVPFGADVHAERTFDGVTVPSRITAGWWHGTPFWAPFFRGDVAAVEPTDSTAATSGRSHA